MLARPGASSAAESALVLDDVMAKLMGEDVTEHETPKRICWPSYEAVVADVRTCRPEFFLLVLRECISEPPRRDRLVVEPYVARPDEFAE
jgi:hypothetical protein